ncbi:MAG: pirin family protein [Schleiferiaceae bacterium]|nr:pirin family protein [Schleiferiaceae bacterium]
MENTKRGISTFLQPRNGIQYVVSSEIREALKPIVFWDAGNFTRNDNGFQIGFHPHSGIGIITYFHGTDLHHEDSGMNDGIIHDGGAQWIRAGGGVWHQEAYRPKHDHNEGDWTGSIHQLWLQLPPEFEEAEVEYANLSKEEIPSIENVKVLVGEYKGVKGKMNVPVNMTYLDVNLKKGQKFEFNTPSQQSSGFVFKRKGSLKIDETSMQKDSMAVLDQNEGLISIEAQMDSEFVLVIAEPSSFPIISSGSQIHTDIDALERSADRIKAIGQELKARE